MTKTYPCPRCGADVTPSDTYPSLARCPECGVGLRLEEDADYRDGEPHGTWLDRSYLRQIAP